MDDVIVLSLVQRAKGGDKEALLELICDQKKDYYNIAYVYTENKQDALDAVAEMTVILYQHIKGLKNDEIFYSWSKTILVNCCKKIIKERKKIVFFEEYKEDCKEERYNTKEMRIDILNCIEKLNLDQQEVIKLKYFMDMDYETISQIVKVPLGTAKSRVSKSLVKLKRCFGGEY
jgi:RNA polymerase sigma factor (sigma-70 family)